MEQQKLYIKLPNGRYQEYKAPKPSIDNRLFRRFVKGGKVTYKPCSMLMTNDLPEGVWVVLKHPGSKSITSGNYLYDRYMCMKAGDIQEVSLARLGGMERLADHLCAHWHELPKEDSIYDTCRAIVSFLFSYEKDRDNEE